MDSVVIGIVVMLVAGLFAGISVFRFVRFLIERKRKASAGVDIERKE